jgi:glycerophosphoryl diester phosphodiesterase
MHHLLLLTLLLSCTMIAHPTQGRPTVIAHRGASGYLPEHTLESAAYAHALGADYIEQDVVMSRDDVLIVCHDIHIDTTTDVATRFPDRRRADGRYYAVDFTWAELRTLQVSERFEPKSGIPVYASRFPHNGASFRLCTMEEQLLLIQGLNRSTGRTAGVYPEIKEPAWHAKEGKDPGRALLGLLERFDYRTAQDKVFVQCFDPKELRRLRQELKTELRLVELLDPPTETEDPSKMASRLREIASYAQGVGPHLSWIARYSASGAPAVTTFVADAHAAGLLVHPYTIRSDALPPGMKTLDQLLQFLREADADGLFIDQPDAAVVRRD